ncbi:hypothetical protein [Mycobacterium sp. SMC-4]|uniref:hypothetical protein n=1 Tax=Mycobacterium sp. SMC-4 TaxID=2857059 RepID=UPI003D086721
MTDTDDFFNATPELHTIYQWARARFAAPWAVFGAVLLRVVASTGPEVQLPGIIGGRASLNMIAAFVSPSGGGKGISDKVARLAWPAPITERPIGSGEGIAALFAPPKKEGAERITRAIITISEIDTLAGIAARQGSILLAQLKAAVMGELIGQANASEATSRVVQPHTYRMCMSVGAQPGHTSVIFNDTTGGTPQRILWFPTVDPNMPSVAGADPEPLNTDLPAWTRLSTDIVEIQYGPEEIARTVIDAHLARQRGEAEALDGHALLSRLKVAAGLAILHHRSVVSEFDWQLSAKVMAVSDSTRDWIVTEAHKAARAKVRERAITRATGEEFYDATRLETVRRSILRMLERDTELTEGDLRRRLGRKEKRELFDQAISLLDSEGLVFSRQGDYNGRTFTYWSCVTTPVTHGNSRSGYVTAPVTHDPDATVTSIDSRRSRDEPRPKLSCLKWLSEYVEQLRAEGHTTVESFAVIEAGHAAGYTTSSIHQARTSHPDMHTISRKRGRAIWSIVPDQRPPRHESAAAWLDKWLDMQTAVTVSPEDAKHAGQAAGHPWQSVRRAAGLSDRIESVPAHGDSRTEKIWRIVDPPDQNEDAS